MAISTKNQMGEITLRVAPETLYEKAESVAKKKEYVQSLFQEIETTVNGSTRYWSGSAAESHRKVYNDKREEISERLQRFGENAQILSAMAGGYEKGEAAAVASTETLSSDVLQ